MRECPECGAAYGDEASRCTRDGATLVPEGQDPRIGRQVGSYLVTKCLGRGGMGAVYQAEHPAIGSKVALKFLHKRYAADPGIVDRFFNEARAVNLIGHENVVRVSDFATADDGSPYFVMEFLEGKPLSAWVGSPRPLGEIGPVMLQVADGLQAAHDRGIIHRDLKPDNIFLVTQARRTNVAKIVDFGIAKLLQLPPGTERTQTGVVMGTAHYMSPEQAAGDVSRIGAASDIYSLGVILFQLATGRLPFEGSGFGEILVGHLMKEPPRPRDVAQSVSPALETIILRCLAKDPTARYESMTALYDALAAALDAEGLPHESPMLRSNPPAPRTKSAPPSAPTEPDDRRSRRVPIGAIAGGAAAFVTIVAIAWGLMRPAPERSTPSRVAPTSVTQVERIELVSEPAGVSVVVKSGDESQTYTTPAVLERKSGAGTFAATFSAEGYRPVERTGDDVREGSLRVTMEPLVPAPPAPEPTSPEPVPSKSAAKKRAPRAVGDGMMDVDL